MKKIFGLFFTLVILFFCSNISFSAFPAGDIGTVDVVADFSSLGEDNLTITFKNISDDTETGNAINWKIQEIEFPKKDVSDQWKWSTTYAVITATITKPNVSFYLYQRNTEGSVYISTTPRTNGDGSTVYSGLVNKDLQGGDYGGYVPLSFLFTANKLSSSDLQQIYNPETMTESGDKVARYFTDVADSNFNPQYSVIACANTGGIAFFPYDASGAYAPWSPASVVESKTAYLYFGGNFLTLLYDYPVFGTDKIVIEKVIE